MSLEDIPTMVLEIAEFARGSRGKDTGKEDFLGVVTMEVLDLDGNLMDANLIRRDVREVVVSGSQGDMTRCGSGFVVAIGMRDRGVKWLGGSELIDERDSGDRDRYDRGQLCTGRVGGASTMDGRLTMRARTGSAMVRTEWTI